MVKSQARRLVPVSNLSRWLQALISVSCTRSSASAPLRLIDHAKALKAGIKATTWSRQSASTESGPDRSASTSAKLSTPETAALNGLENAPRPLTFLSVPGGALEHWGRPNVQDARRQRARGCWLRFEFWRALPNVDDP